MAARFPVTQAAVRSDSTPEVDGRSEGEGGQELSKGNSPLTAAEPPSPQSPEQDGDAASPGELLSLPPRTCRYTLSADSE